MGNSSIGKARREDGIDAVLYDQASVEPTDVSFKDAIKFAVEGIFNHPMVHAQLMPFESPVQAGS